MRGVSVCVAHMGARSEDCVAVSRAAKSVQLVLMGPDGYEISSKPPSKDGADQIRPSEAKTEAETGDNVTTSQGRNDTPPKAPAPHKTPSDRAILTLLLVSGQITQAEYMAYEYIHGKNRNRQRIAFATTANFMVSSSRLPPDPVWRVLNTPEVHALPLHRQRPLGLPPGLVDSPLRAAPVPQAIPQTRRLRHVAENRGDVG